MNNIFSKINDLLRRQYQVNRGPARRTAGPPKKAIPYCSPAPQRQMSFKSQQFTPNFQSPYVYKKVIDPSIKQISNNNLVLPDVSTPKHYVLSNTIQTHYSQFSPFYKSTNYDNEENDDESITSTNQPLVPLVPEFIINGTNKIDEAVETSQSLELNNIENQIVTPKFNGSSKHSLDEDEKIKRIGMRPLREKIGKMSSPILMENIKNENKKQKMSDDSDSEKEVIIDNVENNNLSIDSSKSDNSTTKKIKNNVLHTTFGKRSRLDPSGIKKRRTRKIRDGFGLIDSSDSEPEKEERNIIEL